MQPPPSGWLVGDTIGRYHIQRLIGEGGAGEVYQAEHGIIHTSVAIKVLTGLAANNPELYTRFVREARATNSIVSPHVPRYYDFGQLPDGRPYAVMEYFNGETLAAYIARRGALPLAESTDILRQLAEGMCAAHKTGVVHRDLKPDNIFLVPKPSGGMHVVILDFGIAKLVGPSDSDNGVTRAGLFIGTPHYCAPEQISGARVTEATDVYALGVIAYELLSGRRPFDGEGLEPLGTKLAMDAPSLAEQPAPLPFSVVNDVAKMLARDSKDRLPTMTSALACFQAWAKLTVSGAPTIISTPIADSLRVQINRPWRWGTTLVVAIAASILGGAIGFASRGSQPATHATCPPAPSTPSASNREKLEPEPPAPVVAAPVATPASAPAAVATPAPSPVATPAPSPVAAPAPKRATKAKPKATTSNVIVADPFE